MTLGAEYFRGCYAAAADPWGLATRWYEARKYALTLALLPRERYAAAFEPGCVTARNVGLARAAGVRALLRRTSRYLDPADLWLATTDADTLVPAHWLRHQVRHANHGWDAVVGTIRVTDWAGHRQRAQSLFRDRYLARGGPHPHPHPHPHVHGANLGFRAAAYLAAGGFPEQPTAEDHALVAALDTEADAAPA